MDMSGILSGAGDGLDVGRLTSAVGEVFQSQGGADGLTRKLRDGGLGTEVDSWISTGSNQSVDPERLGAALGPDTVQQLSDKAGISVASLLPLLAAFLPQIIDLLTPGGQLPEGGGTGSMGDIGQVIGNVLGGGGLGNILGGG